MHARKSLGQHFLMHPATGARIAATAELTPLDVVVEIGPGTGILTRSLLRSATKVIGIEADAGLAKKLETTFAKEIEHQTFELQFGDIRNFQLETLPPDYVVVANIPYYITGEILRMFLSTENLPKSMTLLVQKEVAERIARSKKESILSLSVKAYGTPKYEFTVPRGAFIPPPKVDSAVLSIRGISRRNFVNAAHEERFFRAVRAGFSEKRKQMGKKLKEAGFILPPEMEKKRAEDVPLADWLELTR